MPKTVLIAEDSETVRRFISLALKIKGYNVISAVDGMDALEKLPSETIDLLITDLNMPNIDGLSLIKNIREIPEYKELPIIILSSMAKDEDVSLGLRTGANSYLIKPFSKEKMLYEVSKYLD